MARLVVLFFVLVSLVIPCISEGREVMQDGLFQDLTSVEQLQGFSSAIEYRKPQDGVVPWSDDWGLSLHTYNKPPASFFLTDQLGNSLLTRGLHEAVVVQFSMNGSLKAHLPSIQSFHGQSMEYYTLNRWDPKSRYTNFLVVIDPDQGVLNAIDGGYGSDDRVLHWLFRTGTIFRGPTSGHVSVEEPFKSVEGELSPLLKWRFPEIKEVDNYFQCIW